MTQRKNKAIDVVVKMMSKALALEPFKQYYIGVLKTRGSGILKLMDTERDDLFNVLKRTLQTHRQRGIGCSVCQRRHREPIETGIQF